MCPGTQATHTYVWHTADQQSGTDFLTFYFSVLFTSMSTPRVFLGPFYHSGVGQDILVSSHFMFEERKIRSLWQGHIWRGILSWPRQCPKFLVQSDSTTSMVAIILFHELPHHIFFLLKKTPLKQIIIIKLEFWRNLNYHDEQTFLSGRTTPSP